jgi:hypothetical protein
MTEDLYEQQARRARDLAEKADPFTKRRLLELADRYDGKAGKLSGASRMIEPPPSRLPMNGYGESGEK